MTRTTSHGPMPQSQSLTTSSVQELRNGNVGYKQREELATQLAGSDCFHRSVVMTQIMPGLKSNPGPLVVLANLPPPDCRASANSFCTICDVHIIYDNDDSNHIIMIVIWYNKKCFVLTH